MSAFKDYLGDSVYADFDGFAVVLEPEVLAALNRYYARVTAERETPKTNERLEHEQ